MKPINTGHVNDTFMSNQTTCLIIKNLYPHMTSEQIPEDEGGAEKII